MKPTSALVILAALTSTAHGDEREIVIVGTTNLHARVSAVDHYSGRRLPGGLARVQSLVKDLRAQHPSILLVDSGDLLQGDPLEEIYLLGAATGEDPMAKVANYMGYDAVVPGSHDFDFGMESVQSVVRQCRFPWVAANVRRADTNDHVFVPYAVKEMAGVRIAVLGLTNQGPAVWRESAIGRALQFGDPVDEARAAVPMLREKERADVVVVLAHGGPGESPWRPAYDGYREAPGRGPENFAIRLAREVDGIDVILAGHSNEEVDGLLVDDCLVVQAGPGGTSVAVVNLKLLGQIDGIRVTERTAELLTTQGVSPSDEILDLIEEDLRRVETYLSEPLGICASPLDASSSLVADNAAVDLIHKVQLQYTGAQVSVTSCFDVGFRLPAGEIRRGDLHRLYPNSNTLLAVEMAGKEIRDYLEHAAACFSTYDFSGAAPPELLQRRLEDYDTLEGVDYELDLTRPKGNRVVTLNYRDRPLRRDALLKVALNSHRRAGGGGYPGVSGLPLVYDRQQSIRSLLAEYVRQYGLLQGEATGNWRLVPDYLGHWASERVDYLYREDLVGGRKGLFRPETAVETREFASWLAGTFMGDAGDAGRFRSPADSLGLSWDEPLRRLDALRLAFASVRPDTAQWREFGWRFADWQALQPSDQVVVGTALARGWLVDAPWAVADTAASLTRAEAASLTFSTRFRKLTLVATNDLHGGIEPRATEGARRTEVGGIARIAGVVDSLRRRNPGGVVVLDVGDFMQATFISNAFHGKPVVEAYNMIGYDALAVGNHEFDWGQDVLEERASEARFPFLSANIVQTETGLPPPYLAPSAIVERGDLLIGVVGLTTPETPYIVKADNVTGLSFLEMTPSARDETEALRGAGADVVIVAAHVGVDRLQDGTIGGPAFELAEALEDIDLLFSGHSHSLLDTVVGGCPVVQARCCGQAVAIGKILYDRNAGNVVSRGAEVLTRLDGRRNASLDSLVAYYQDAVAEAGEKVVAILMQQLTRAPNDAGETALGDLVADAQRAATGAQIALMNSGGIRADLPKGEITWAMLYAVQPFENQLVVLTLTGAQVREALEQGVGRAGRAVQVSGLTFGYDPNAPEGSRVTSVTLEDGGPLSADSTYRVVVNDFMWGGGDRFAVLKEAQAVKETYIVDVDAFGDHLASLPQPVTYELQNRITLAQ